ncbi:MAG: trypsin-like peptidase domain-containing protein [Pyrinomonadaceae bacterium]|nr:trypsin-like peptidase domain-containing protein [Pyrinomonadaceae bacterium]
MTDVEHREDTGARFSALKDARDVASLLDVSYEYLRHHLYRAPAGERYTLFTIRKKSGGVREIMAPRRPLKLLQHRLAKVLECVYEPKSSTHGFTRKRNVLTNAHIHARRKHVLNIDLLDFFPSINFGRVRGMFMANPYRCPPEVATVLAQICSHNNQLPQGAPTSPVISNMLCARMDRHLQEVAKQYRCAYTRYADDLTFSTYLDEFPPELASMQTEHGVDRCVPGRTLVNIVTKRNGFRINESKVRLQNNKQRQEVTGLTTNKFPNVQRAYVRVVRAMLHNWKKHGLEAAQRQYLSKYNKQHRPPESVQPLFRYMVKGKIEYLGMVRGKDDAIYQRFLKRLRELAPDLVKASSVDDPYAKILDRLWVLETEEIGKCSQGTAFYIQDYGFVTCAHVLGESELAIITAHTRHDASQKYRVKVTAKDDQIDLARLEVIGVTPQVGLKVGASESLQIGDAIKLAGFPNHHIDDTGIVASGTVIGRRNAPVTREPRILISANIIAGNSGGPVLDSNNRVIGVAVRGGANEEESRNTEFHGVVPIEALGRLVVAGVGGN